MHDKKARLRGAIVQFCVYEFEFVHDDDGWYEVYPFVTPARVSQMVKGHVITGWREGTRTWVDLESLENYMKRRRCAGRPKKTCEPDVSVDEDMTDDAPQAAVG